MIHRFEYYDREQGRALLGGRTRIIVVELEKAKGLGADLIAQATG